MVDMKNAHDGTRAEAMRAIETTAAASAATLLEQGWDRAGAQYDVGTYHGDSEALSDALGRPTTREERIVLEAKIRELLDAAYRGDGGLGKAGEEMSGGGLTIEFATRDDGRLAVSAWRGPRSGQPDIDGFYRPGSGDTSAICGATEEEADQIAHAADARFAAAGKAVS